jgi:GT2 family glycosyltransferase
VRFLVVVLSFNNARSTLQLLEHMKRDWISARHRLVVRVLDNGSNDEHREVLAAFAGVDRPDLSIEVSREPVNLGFARGVNRVIAATDDGIYDSIILSNDDIEIDATALDGLLTQFEERSDIWVLAPAIGHSQHTEPLAGGDVTWAYRVKYGTPSEPRGLHRVGFVPFTFAIFREQPARGDKLLDEAVFFGEEDVEYAVRCTRERRCVMVDDRVVVTHDASQTRRRNSTADVLDERLLGAASRSVTVRRAVGPVRWQLWRLITLAGITFRAVRTAGLRPYARFVRHYFRETARTGLDRDDFYRLAKINA